MLEGCWIVEQQMSNLIPIFLGNVENSVWIFEDAFHVIGQSMWSHDFLHDECWSAKESPKHLHRGCRWNFIRLLASYVKLFEEWPSCTLSKIKRRFMYIRNWVNSTGALTRIFGIWCLLLLQMLKRWMPILSELFIKKYRDLCISCIICKGLIVMG